MCERDAGPVERTTKSCLNYKSESTFADVDQILTKINECARGGVQKVDQILTKINECARGGVQKKNNGKLKLSHHYEAHLHFSALHSEQPFKRAVDNLSY